MSCSDPKNAPHPAPDADPDRQDEEGFDFTPYAWDGEEEDEFGDLSYDGPGNPPLPAYGPAFYSRPVTDDVDEDGEQEGGVEIDGVRYHVAHDVPAGETVEQAIRRVSQVFADPWLDASVTYPADSAATAYVQFERESQVALSTIDRVPASRRASSELARSERKLHTLLAKFCQAGWALEVARARMPTDQTVAMPGWTRASMPEWRSPMDPEYNYWRARLLGDIDPERFSVVDALERMERTLFCLAKVTQSMSSSMFDCRCGRSERIDHARVGNTVGRFTDAMCMAERARRQFKKLRTRQRQVVTGRVVYVGTSEAPPGTSTPVPPEPKTGSEDGQSNDPASAAQQKVKTGKVA